MIYLLKKINIDYMKMINYFNFIKSIYIFNIKLKL